MREGRQKGEGTLGIAFVFGQVKRDAAEQMPQRIDGMQIVRETRRMSLCLVRNELRQFLPELAEHFGRQVLKPAHGRHIGGQFTEFLIGWRRDRSPVIGGAFAQLANGSEKTPGISHAKRPAAASECARFLLSRATPGPRRWIAQRQSPVPHRRRRLEHRPRSGTATTRSCPAGSIAKILTFTQDNGVARL